MTIFLLCFGAGLIAALPVCLAWRLIGRRRGGSARNRSPAFRFDPVALDARLVRHASDEVSS
ncbi:hypothetical protein [Caballeronia sordidicola]|uniref:Uncharacterized protein n=1 Tax=Caballeronia sordidicola TaxID=196367 RepID=A0A226WQX7_CABSO|nr:hypothetical protein [Caballeronia sordidicola]OXC73503.1 hypothetical protein BSU04_35525 [Caballeronia sordidicola]